MDDALTDEELAEIERRCAAARPGRWTFVEGRDHVGGSNMIRVTDDDDSQRDIEPFGATIEDQDFIAHARQDVPRLVAEIRRLRALLR
jgi:hypothetical protein